jgi:hypothetical protein
MTKITFGPFVSFWYFTSFRLSYYKTPCRYELYYYYIEIAEVISCNGLTWRQTILLLRILGINVK